MKRYSASKEINTLVRQLVRDGWQFQRGGQHGKLYAPNRTTAQPHNLFKRALNPE